MLGHVGRPGQSSIPYGKLFNRRWILKACNIFKNCAKPQTERVLEDQRRLKSAPPIDKLLEPELIH